MAAKPPFLIAAAIWIGHILLAVSSTVKFTIFLSENNGANGVRNVRLTSAEQSTLVEVTSTILDVEQNAVSLASWANYSLTSSPTMAPTASPTLQSKTVAPTLQPTLSSQSTLSPTVAPTRQPTLSPTMVPTLQPTAVPTVSWSVGHNFTASDLTAASKFGSAISSLASTTDIVVSAYEANSKKGAAYVYSKSANNKWEKMQKLVTTERVTFDYFGRSVAGLGASLLATGRYGYDGGGGSSSGGALIFTKSSDTWAQAASFVNNDNGANDQFGRGVVAFEQNTSTIAVSAPHASNDSEHGSAYVFEMDGNNVSSWDQTAKIYPTDIQTDDKFAGSIQSMVSIYNDTLVIGAQYHSGDYSSSGAVWVFTRPGQTWVQEAKLLNSDQSSSDRFGISITKVSSASIMIGAVMQSSSSRGAAYFFTKTSGSWYQAQKLTASDGEASDLFGVSLASFDENSIMIGSTGAGAGGAVYHFTTTPGDGTWRQAARLNATGAAGGGFGSWIHWMTNSSALVGAEDEDIGVVYEIGISTTTGARRKLEEKGAAHHSQQVPSIKSLKSRDTFSGRELGTVMAGKSVTLQINEIQNFSRASSTLESSISSGSYLSLLEAQGMNYSQLTLISEMQHIMGSGLTRTSSSLLDVHFTGVGESFFVMNVSCKYNGDGWYYARESSEDGLNFNATVQVIETDGTYFAGRNGSTLHLTIDGLKNDTEYKVFFLAANNQHWYRAVSTVRTAPAPPSLLSAYFSPSGAIVAISFSSDTDLGASSGLGAPSLGVPFACAALFNFSSGAAGEATCAFTSPARVAATLGTGATLLPGDALTLLPSTVRTACHQMPTVLCNTQAYAGASSVTVAPPTVLPSPMIVVEYEQTLSNCSNATLDASGSLGSGGREMAYSWRSLNSTGVSSPLNLWLEEQTSNKIVIPNRYLNPGYQYNISLTASNFLGGNSSELISFKISYEEIPTVVLSGFSSFWRSEAVEIFAAASTSMCSGKENISASSELTYVWEFLTDKSVTSISADPRWFKLSAYSLNSLEDYKVKATVADSKGRQNHAIFSFSVEQHDLYAVVEGGDRTVGNSLALSVDGSSSRDLNTVDGSPRNATFSWHLPAVYSSGNINYTIDSSALKISKEVLVEGTHTFALSLLQGRRVSNASVDITVLGEPLPTCQITTSLITKVNANSKLIIQGSTTAHTDDTAIATWSEDYGTGYQSSTALSSVSSTPMIKTVSGLSSSSFYLVVPAGELVAGADYSFRLSAAYAAAAAGAAAAAAASALAAAVNRPPSAGALAAAPRAGAALADSFTLTTSSWADDPEDLPIQYEFFYTSFQSDNEPTCNKDRTIIRTMKASNAARGLKLPVNPDGNLTVGVAAFDILGADAAVCTSVLVDTIGLGAEWVAELAGNLLAEALASYDSDTLFGTTEAAISALSYEASISSEVFTSFQRSLIDTLSASTSFMDLSSGTTSQLSSALASALNMNTTLHESTLLAAQNVTVDLLGKLGALGAAPSPNARRSTLASLSALLDAGVANTSGASDFYAAATYMAQLITLDLVEDEDPVTQTSDSLQMAGAILSVGDDGGLASLSSPKPTGAGSEASWLKVTGGLENTAASRATLIEFSSDPHAGAPEEPAPSGGGGNASALTTSVLRLGLRASAGRNVTAAAVTAVLQQSAAQPAVSGGPREEWELNVTCQEGVQEMVTVVCGQGSTAQVAHACTGSAGVFGYKCRAPWTGPQCLVYDEEADGWTDQYCTVQNYSTTFVECSCFMDTEAYNGVQSRRVLRKGTGKVGEDSKEFQMDFAANIVGLGSEVAANFAITSDIFENPNLIAQNSVVFIVMGCVLVAIPLLGFGSACFHHYFQRVRSKRGKNTNDSDISSMDQTRHAENVLTISTFQHMADELKYGNDYIQLFLEMSFNDKAVLVAKLWCFTLSLMFWDATFYALMFPPGVNDCWLVPTKTDCLESDMKCVWDDLVASCGPYSVEETPEEVLYVAALSTFVTMPVMIFWEWFFDKFLVTTESDKEVPEDTSITEDLFPPKLSDNEQQGPTFVAKEEERSLNAVHSRLELLDDEPLLIMPTGGIPRYLSKPHRLSWQRSNKHSMQQRLGGSMGGPTGGPTGGLHKYSSSRRPAHRPLKKGRELSVISDDNSQEKTTSSNELGILEEGQALPHSRSLSVASSHAALLENSAVQDSHWTNKGSVMTSSFRQELQKVNPWLEESIIESRVNKFKHYILSYGKQKSKIQKNQKNVDQMIRQEVIKALNLEKKMESMSWAERNTFLLEAAWHDSLSDSKFHLLEKYMFDEPEKDSCCFDRYLEKWKTCRVVFGWSTLIVYNIIMAFYVCLFGINYGESYTTGWMKSFAFGFGQDMLFMGPFVIILLHLFLHFGVEKRANLSRIRKFQVFAASRQAAEKYPDLTTSKIILDPTFVPPKAYRPYLMQKKPQQKNWLQLKRGFRHFISVCAFVFLKLPMDLQGLLCEAFGLITIYYGSGYLWNLFFSNMMLCLVILASILVAYIFGWCLILFPSTASTLMFNSCFGQCLVEKCCPLDDEQPFEAEEEQSEEAGDETVF